MSADEDLRRAAKLARQLADHAIADALDLAVRDHERGSCTAVEQDEECYREMQARDYLAKHRDVPLLSSSDAPNRTATGPVVDTDLRDRIAEVARYASGTTTGSQSYAPIYWDDVAADIYGQVVAPVLAERDELRHERDALADWIRKEQREGGMWHRMSSRFGSVGVGAWQYLTRDRGPLTEVIEDGEP